jgi:hypothetical protein
VCEQNKSDHHLAAINEIQILTKASSAPYKKTSQVLFSTLVCTQWHWLSLTKQNWIKVNSTKIATSICLISRCHFWHKHAKVLWLPWQQPYGQNLRPSRNNLYFSPIWGQSSFRWILISLPLASQDLIRNECQMMFVCVFQYKDNELRVLLLIQRPRRIWVTCEEFIIHDDAITQCAQVHDQKPRKRLQSTTFFCFESKNRQLKLDDGWTRWNVSNWINISSRYCLLIALEIW